MTKKPIPPRFSPEHNIAANAGRLVRPFDTWDEAPESSWIDILDYVDPDWRDLFLDAKTGLQFYSLEGNLVDGRYEGEVLIQEALTEVFDFVWSE